MSDFSLDDKWRFLRNTRNARLKESDWTQLPDADLTTAQKTAWTNYRQQLRDLPSTNSNPDLITFPESSLG